MWICTITLSKQHNYRMRLAVGDHRPKVPYPRLTRPAPSPDPTPPFVTFRSADTDPRERTSPYVAPHHGTVLDMRIFLALSVQPTVHEPANPGREARGQPGYSACRNLGGTWTPRPPRMANSDSGVILAGGRARADGLEPAV